MGKDGSKESRREAKVAVQAGGPRESLLQRSGKRR